jgi:hypothetical protein
MATAVATRRGTGRSRSVCCLRSQAQDARWRPNDADCRSVCRSNGQVHAVAFDAHSCDRKARREAATRCSDDKCRRSRADAATYFDMRSVGGWRRSVENALDDALAAVASKSRQQDAQEARSRARENRRANLAAETIGRAPSALPSTIAMSHSIAVQVHKCIHFNSRKNCVLANGGPANLLRSSASNTTLNCTPIAAPTAVTWLVSRNRKASGQLRVDAGETGACFSSTASTEVNSSTGTLAVAVNAWVYCSVGFIQERFAVRFESDTFDNPKR